VENFEVTDAGYDHAYQALYDRYENKKLIVADHISELFNIKSMQEESVVELRLLLDETSKHLRALKTLGEPVEQWDSLLVHIICFRLDYDTRKAWESIHALKKEVPKWKELSEFLNGRCQVLESMEFNQRKQSSFTKEKVKYEASSSSAKTRNLKCSLCAKQHERKPWK
jgi:hypothetical protein